MSTYNSRRFPSQLTAPDRQRHLYGRHSEFFQTHINSGYKFRIQINSTYIINLDEFINFQNQILIGQKLELNTYPLNQVFLIENNWPLIRNNWIRKNSHNDPSILIKETLVSLIKKYQIRTSFQNDKGILDENWFKRHFQVKSS